MRPNPSGASAPRPSASVPEEEGVIPRRGKATAEQWVAQVSGLVSLPDVCGRLFEMLQSRDTSAREIGEVISRDPNLTARLLRIVNSAFYNFSRRIDTVSRAIIIIGDRELFNLVLAVSAVKSFAGIPNTLINMDTFWRHSIYSGLIARNLAKRCRVLHSERLFVAGLLHDIGSLVLYNRAPGVARELLMVAQGDEETLHQAEREALGFSHADLGGLLLDKWMLPVALRDAVRCHHDPAAAADGAFEAAIVHIADVFACRSELGALFEEPAADVEIKDCAWQTIGLSPAQVDEEQVIGEAGLQFAETASLLVASR